MYSNFFNVVENLKDNEIFLSVLSGLVKNSDDEAAIRANIELAKRYSEVAEKMENEKACADRVVVLKDRIEEEKRGLAKLTLKLLELNEKLKDHIKNGPTAETVEPEKPAATGFLFFRKAKKVQDARSDYDTQKALLVREMESVHWRIENSKACISYYQNEIKSLSGATVTEQTEKGS